MQQEAHFGQLPIKSWSRTLVESEELTNIIQLEQRGTFEEKGASKPEAARQPEAEAGRSIKPAWLIKLQANVIAAGAAEP